MWHVHPVLPDVPFHIKTATFRLMCHNKMYITRCVLAVWCVWVVSHHAHHSSLLCFAPTPSRAPQQTTSKEHQIHIKHSMNPPSEFDVLLSTSGDVFFETHQTKPHQSCLM